MNIEWLELVMEEEERRRSGQESVIHKLKTQMEVLCSYAELSEERLPEQLLS